MAAKKKTVKQTPARKKAPARRPRPAPIEAISLAPAEAPRESMSFAPLIIFALVVAGLYFAFRSPEGEMPPAHKAASGVQISATPAPQPIPSAAASGTVPVAPPAPQKRATSPAGPRVWEGAKAKHPARFYVLSDKDGKAQVSIFRAGNVPVIVLRSEGAPKKTVELKWDGKDSKGQAAPAGTYYARISGAHGDMVEEIRIK